MSAGEAQAVLGELEFNRTVAALSREYDGVFTEETIARFVQESLDRWPAPKVRAHVEVRTTVSP